MFLAQDEGPLGLGNPGLETLLILGVVALVIGIPLLLGLRQRVLLRRKNEGK